MYSEKIQNIYVDMDGVLAKWRLGASLEEVSSKDYFLQLDPEESIIEAIKILHGRGKSGICPPIKILSAALSVRAAWEKQQWLKAQGLSNLEYVFMPYGDDKAKYVECPESSILIDDFGENLKVWPGVKVKFYNGINGHGGTVYQYSIRSDWRSREIVNYIRRMCKC